MLEQVLYFGLKHGIRSELITGQTIRHYTEFCDEAVEYKNDILIL